MLVFHQQSRAEYNANHYRINPFHVLAKVAVTRMAWAHAKRPRTAWRDFGLHYAGLVAIGAEAGSVWRDRRNWREATLKVPHFVISETPRFVGRAIAASAADPDRSRWNGQSTSSGGLAQTWMVLVLTRGDIFWRCKRQESRPMPAATDKLWVNQVKASDKEEILKRRYDHAYHS